MAADSETIARNAKEGWKGFCWFLGLSTAGVFLTLGLMAIFLL